MLRSISDGNDTQQRILRDTKIMMFSSTMQVIVQGALFARKLIAVINEDE